MRKLSVANYQRLARIANTFGNYNPENIFLIEEELTSKQFDILVAFMQFLYNNNLNMGRGNYQQRFSEFLESKKKPKTIK